MANNRRIYKRKRKNNWKYILVLLVILLAGYCYKYYQNNHSIAALNPRDTTGKIVSVKHGDTLTDLAILLQKDKIIRSANAFIEYGNKHDSPTLVAGDYRFFASQDIEQIYKTIKKGPTPNLRKKEFIKTRAPYAIEMYKKYGILPSINLAQTILESQWGESKLAYKYNNYYGIKAQGKQKYVELQTTEYYDGETESKVKAKFAVYDNWQDSMLAHSLFLKNGTKAGHKFTNVLKAQNYQQAAQALEEDGYATDPDYAQKLITLIRDWNLEKYDQEAQK